MRAIETHVIAVKVPIPCEIIKEGGTIIDKGLKVGKFNLIAWDAKSSPRIRIICLLVIVGFSFFEKKINKVQQIRISRKVIDQEKIISGFKGFISRSLKDEIIDITMHIRKITNSSIFWKGVGNLDGDWLLIHKILNFFNSRVRFCTEYNLIYFFFYKL